MLASQLHLYMALECQHSGTVDGASFFYQMPLSLPVILNATAAAEAR
jgi:hypothetical protein